MSEVTSPILTDATGQEIVSKLNTLLTKMDNLAAAFQPNASGIVYNNTTSGLTGDDVQEAIDEMAGDVSEIKSALSDLDLNVPHFKGMFDITTDLTSDKTYTATESCIVLLKTEGLNMSLYINAYVDGIGIGQTTAQGQTVNNIYAFLKKGSVLTLNASYPYNGTFHAYVV